MKGDYNMKVTLLTASFKDMEKFATLTCHANTEKTYVPHDVLDHIIKAKHESILEHITLTYSVKENITGMFAGACTAQTYLTQR